MSQRKRTRSRKRVWRQREIYIIACGNCGEATDFGGRYAWKKCPKCYVRWGERVSPRADIEALAIRTPTRRK